MGRCLKNLIIFFARHMVIDAGARALVFTSRVTDIPTKKIE